MQVKIEINQKATVDKGCSVLLAHTRGLVRERWFGAGVYFFKLKKFFTFDKNVSPFNCSFSIS